MNKSWRYIKKGDCPHLADLNEDVKSDKTSCEVCGIKDDLRICLTCGAVFCCESSNSHNTEHFKKTGHPFIRPHNLPFDWLWCYKCMAFLT